MTFTAASRRTFVACAEQLPVLPATGILPAVDSAVDTLNQNNQIITINYKVMFVWTQCLSNGNPVLLELETSVSQYVSISTISNMTFA